MKFVLTAILLLCPLSVLAAMPIEVVATADDPVGSKLVYELKEQIRASNSMELTFDESKPRMQVQVVTLEQDKQNPGISTVYSLVVTWENPSQPFPFYLTQYTGFCGSARTASCASTLVSKISEQSDAILRLMVNASKSK